MCIRDSERSEAVLLRHLSEVYKVLVQTVPPSLKTEEVEEAESFLEEIVRGVDSSLIDEWERLRDHEEVVEKVSVKEVPYTRRKAEFVRATRRVVFDFVKEISRENYEAAADLVGSKAFELREMMTGYFEEHGIIRMDPEARSSAYLRIEGDRLEQILVDEEGLNDWSVILDLDRAQSDVENRVVLCLRELGAF